MNVLCAALASNCVSIAIKLWCIPVITIGAYKKPKIAPPTGPNEKYNHCNPSASTLPASLNTGPTAKNVINPVINTDNKGVVKLSNQEGVILCNLVSNFAINQDTNKIGRTVP